MAWGGIVRRAACALALVGCQEDLRLESLLFACESNSDCSLGLVCGTGNICATPGVEPDAQGAVPDAPVQPADGACPAPAEAYRRILATGTTHVCTIRGDTLYCWGNNADGQLGIDQASPSMSSPMEVAGEQRWAHVTTGTKPTCGLTDVGALFCWGGNGDGQLGDGTTDPASSPVAIAPEQTWTTVAAGSSFTCAITTDAALYCWGSNAEGELGVGLWTGPDVLEPVAIGELGSQWLAVTLGQSHGCALKLDGTLWCWSGSEFGEDGQGLEAALHEPTEVGAGSCWLDMDLGIHASMAMREDHTLHGFGGNTHRRLAVSEDDHEACKHSESNNCLSTPTEIVNPGPWRELALGWFHGCGIQDDGTLWGWGGNADQEGPFGTTEPEVHPPMKVTIEGAAAPFLRVVIGQNHTCAMDSAGDLWCAGRNEEGQLGRGFSGGSQANFDRVLWP
jgi:alpha-tubulin suppressor-like RCC1 family protein